MTPYDPPKPGGSYGAFLRNTRRSNSPGVSPCLSRIVRKQTRCALSSARPALACTASNVSHHHPQTANLCTAHQSASLCLACVYWGRDETPRRESRRAHFLIIPNYKSAKWTFSGQSKISFALKQHASGGGRKHGGHADTSQPHTQTQIPNIRNRRECWSRTRCAYAPSEREVPAEWKQP